MHTIIAADGIEYGLLQEEDAEAMARLLAKVFSELEPMGRAVGIPCEQVERLVKTFVPKALTEQLTILARDASSSRLVGAMLADDLGTDGPTGLDEAAPQFAPIGSLLGVLDEQYRAVTTVAKGTHAHMFMVGVEASSQLRGIATRLVETCMANAAADGYKTAVTEATGSVSQHVFRKLGFVDRFQVLYQEFTFDGQRVFPSIEGVDGTVLMTRELSDRSSSSVRFA